MKESENHVFVFPTRKMPGTAFFEIPYSSLSPEDRSGLLSTKHFSVDRTLIESKSLPPMGEALGRTLPGRRVVGCAVETWEAEKLRTWLALLTVFVNGVREASRYLLVDGERDGDGVGDASDNCPLTDANGRQLDTDGDAQGDRCDSDDDNDSMTDAYELDNRFDPLDPGDAAGDADLDGETNLAESRLGSDPRDPNDNRRSRSAVLNAVIGVLFD